MSLEGVIRVAEADAIAGVAPPFQSMLTRKRTLTQTLTRKRKRKQTRKRKRKRMRKRKQT